VGLRTRRNLKGAVVRNRLKRQLRPIIQAQRASWRSGFDIVIVIHPKSLPVEAPALQRELTQLAKRAGIVQ
jgi:ribonuclease P protein component